MITHYSSFFRFSPLIMVQTFSSEPGAIGVFDSGYGGLTILEEIRREMPQYDYIYVGE